MPSKIQHDENLWFLYICIENSDIKTINYDAVAKLAKIKPQAARMRYTRLKRRIRDGTLTGQHGNTSIQPNMTTSNSTSSIFMHSNRVPSTVMSRTPISEHDSESHRTPSSAMETNAKKRKMGQSDGKISENGICESEKPKIDENFNAMGPSGERLEPEELSETFSDSDDLENMPLSQLRRPIPNPKSSITIPPSLPRSSPPPSFLSKPLPSTQTSPRRLTSSLRSQSQSQPSAPNSLFVSRDNVPPLPFQMATIHCPSYIPLHSSSAIYHDSSAGSGYRYFQGSEGRGTTEYVSPYGRGRDYGNDGDGDDRDDRDEEMRSAGGVNEPFQSAMPVDSIYGRGEFGWPFARGAWGLEIKEEEWT